MNQHRTLSVGDILRTGDLHETYFFQVVGAEHQTALIRTIAAHPRDSTVEQGWVVPAPLLFADERERRCRIIDGEAVEVAPGEIARPWRPVELGDGRRRWALSPSDCATLLARKQLRRDRRTRFKNAASIRSAVDDGRHVFWADWPFHVRKTGDGRTPEAYRIHNLHHGSGIGLTLADGWTPAADIERFFCAW
jgi:hypothetical protein